MFKIGQKVVCKNIDDFKTSAPYGIEKGKVYTITSVCKCVCGKTALELDEAPTMERWCGYTNEYIGYSASFYAYRFELVKYDLISNKEIIKNIITEKSDFTIKEPKLNNS